MTEYKYRLCIAKEIWEKFSLNKQERINELATEYSCGVYIENNSRSIGYDHTIHLISNIPSSLLPYDEWRDFHTKMHRELESDI